MPHYGILREYRFEGEVNDLRGAEVYGVNDEKLGKIDDVIFDHSSGDIRYVVLNTGGLFSRKKVMVPASRIEPYGKHEDKFYAELDKDRLEMLPEFDDKTLAASHDWANYEKEYEKRWNDGVVMYNKDTNRIITPPTEEVAGARRRPLSDADRESLKQDFTPRKMGKEDDLLGVASGTGKTTLRPEKPSKAGKEDVELHHGVPQRELGPMNTEVEFPAPATTAPGPESMREPRVYKVDEPAERRPAGEITVENKGRRWLDFQDRLRARRDKIVVGCSRCGSQERVA